MKIILGLYGGGILIYSVLSSILSKDRRKGNKKTVVTLHHLPYLIYSGNPYYLNRYNFLADNYNLIIFTNRVSFFKKGVKNATVLYIPYLKGLPLIPGYLFWVLCRIRLLVIRYDLLFLRVTDMPFSLLGIRRPILCHVDIEPYQSIDLKDNKSKIPIRRKISFHLVCYGIKKADKVIEVDERLQNFAADQAIEPPKIEYLQAGVNLKLFNKNNPKYVKEVGIPENRFIIIYTGAICETRGLSFLLRGIKSISSKIPDILLILLGDIVDRDTNADDIYNRAKKMGIENNILILPPMEYKLIPSYMEKADVGVSILEATEYYKRSTPQKIFEYQAMGLPVIANNIPTHNIYIENGKNGFIINNIDEFRHAVLKLYHDKELYEQMSMNAIEFAKRYDLKRIHQKFGKIVDNLINN